MQLQNTKIEYTVVFTPYYLSTAVITCGFPPAAPANGQRSGSGITFGSMVTYSCDAGYTLQGTGSINCMANRKWSGSAPHCNGEQLCK